ncbi:MAG: PepSY domain-containing protein [Euryhalocaulis sp.]|uniref:PepSY-associated TM helix domain-containing protein n=1 Tax=Euryhalocaulis sp. TaxID=2744307 RepID=UPI0017BC6E50|nr:PepSY-associated TM helix domain-containing protein [Euryhalocaulis sp.]MBA4800493.1 PepSY domain-containing protein [Euryhalocaulis sp.]
MRFSLPSGFVKRSLASHSWLGLMTGALMYLICLSGTLAVFGQELQQWEQPRGDTFTEFDPQALETTYNELTASGVEVTHHMFVMLPTEKRPRLTISSENQTWLVHPDGTLGAEVAHEWTDMLVNLHLYLHLPRNIGMIFVSAFGAILCGLIVSGFFAHPRILKDAFNLRLGGSRQLEQTDIHNRLSVWGAPFHLVIAVTGAFFGFFGLVMGPLSQTYFDGDRTQAMAALYGAEPALAQDMEPVGLSAALTRMDEIAPQAEPFYLTIEDAGTPQQYMIIGATHPGRLIYAEQYRFDAAGNYLGPAGFADGEAGQQVIFSVYQAHFGQFGGMLSKVFYGIFGLALSVVSVTGINIWLAKRGKKDVINRLWSGFVWGAPVALALSAIAALVLPLSPAGCFWAVMAAAAGLSLFMNQDRTVRILMLASAAALAGVALCHAILFGAYAAQDAALAVNLSAVLLAAGFLAAGLTRKSA